MRYAPWLVCVLILAAFGCAGGGGGDSSGGGGSTNPGPATALAVITQPAAATAGNVFGTQPRIEIRDAAGVRVSTDNTTQVTAAITATTGTGGAMLSGTQTVTAASGVATFTNLSIDLTGTAYTLTFTATGLSDAISGAFDVTTAGAGGGQAPFVPPAPTGAATYYVDDSGAASDSNNGTSAATPWRTLQHAANQVVAGDIVEVADGSYSRMTLSNKNGTSGSPIVFRASGTGAIINSGTSSSVSPDNRDAIKITFSSYIIIHGLRTQNAFRAGCRVDYAPNVTVQGCVFADGGTWGCFTDYSDDCHLIGNECYGSQREHGIYHSNGGDRAIIRGNYCHNNAAGGIQINADPVSIVPGGGTHEDGICEQCIIERNWCVDNGGGSAAVPGASPPVAGGGACLNFASIRNCDVRNNLLRTQYNQSGIVLWDDGFSSTYGSMNNRVYHNTVVLGASVTRHVFVISNGSTGNSIRNNVCVAGARGIFEFTTDSMSGLTESHNVVYKPSGWAFATDETTSTSYSTLANWQSFSGQGASDDAAQPQFANVGTDDYSLLAGSPGLDDGVNSLGVTGTYDGASRPQGAGYDRGCFED
ncbi:MAG: right-handed parallel beta-helix repeat-containing protein [Planctomycetes bacterium]|nr:right-handed parallel beta-helix repeat-containing protein [Planctomycetota bacterium]